MYDFGGIIRIKKMKSYIDVKFIFESVKNTFFGNKCTMILKYVDSGNNIFVKECIVKDIFKMNINKLLGLTASDNVEFNIAVSRVKHLLLKNYRRATIDFVKKLYTIKKK